MSLILLRSRSNKSKARRLIKLSGGADFTPKSDLSNCWQNTTGTIAGAEDAVCALLESDFRSGGENLIVDSESATGTESTSPTSWKLVSHNGITISCVGKGVDSEGHGYSLVRFSGTASSTAYPSVYFLNNDSDFPSTNGMLFSASIRIKIHAGSTTGVSAVNYRMVAGKNSSNSNTTDLFTSNIISSLSVSEQNFSGSGVLADAATVAVNSHLMLTVASGNTVDLTLQISQPQLNRGRPQAYTPTYGTAVSNGTYHCLTQATAGYTPFLRKSLSVLPVTNPNLTLGPELVTNGTFDSDLTGWTGVGSPSTSAVESGRYHLVTSTFEGIKQTITGLTAGKRYKVTCSIEVSSGSAQLDAVDVDVVGGSAVTATSAGTGTQTLTFYAQTTGTTLSVQCAAVYGVGTNAYFDNVSVKEITAGSPETWTISRTQVSDCAGIRWDESGVPYFKAVGVANNYASTPNTVANQITGDACWVFKLYCTDFSYNSSLLDKFGSAGNYGSVVWVGTNGKLQLTASDNGTAFNTQQSDNAIAAATKLWVRVKRVSSTGSITFETSPDGETWTQNGAAKTGLTGALFNSTDSLTIGAGYPGNEGKFRIYYAAIYANADGTGTPAVEFDPSGVVRPTSYWLDADGVDDYYVSTVQPGLYDAGYVCGAFNQYEAIGQANAMFGSSGSNAVHGVRLNISTTNYTEITRFDGTTNTKAITAGTITQYAPFVVSCNYTVSDAAIDMNGGAAGTTGTDRDYSGTSQVALAFAANNAESGITATNYFTGSSSGMCWLPAIPTDEQQAILRSYYASLGQVTL